MAVIQLSGLGLQLFVLCAVPAELNWQRPNLDCTARCSHLVWAPLHAPPGVRCCYALSPTPQPVFILFLVSFCTLNDLPSSAFWPAVDFPCWYCSVADAFSLLAVIYSFIAALSQKPCLTEPQYSMNNKACSTSMAAEV